MAYGPRLVDRLLITYPDYALDALRADDSRLKGRIQRLGKEEREILKRQLDIQIHYRQRIPGIEMDTYPIEHLYDGTLCTLLNAENGARESTAGDWETKAILEKVILLRKLIRFTTAPSLAFSEIAEQYALEKHRLVRFLDRLIPALDEDSLKCRFRKMGAEVQQEVLSQFHLQIRFRKSQVNGCTGSVPVKQLLRDGMLSTLLTTDDPDCLPLADERVVEEMLRAFRELRSLSHFEGLSPPSLQEIRMEFGKEQQEREKDIREVRQLRVDLACYGHGVAKGQGHHPFRYSIYSEKGQEMLINFVAAWGNLHEAPLETVDPGLENLKTQLEKEECVLLAYYQKIDGWRQTFIRNQPFLELKEQQPELAKAWEFCAQGKRLFEDSNIHSDLNPYLRTLAQLREPNYGSILTRAFQEMQTASWYLPSRKPLAPLLDKIRSVGISSEEAFQTYRDFFTQYFSMRLAELKWRSFLPPECFKTLDEGVVSAEHLQSIQTLLESGVSVEQIAVRDHFEALRPYIYGSMYAVLSHKGKIVTDAEGLGETVFLQGRCDQVSATPAEIDQYRTQVLEAILRKQIIINNKGV